VTAGGPGCGPGRSSSGTCSTAIRGSPRCPWRLPRSRRTRCTSSSGASGPWTEPAWRTPTRSGSSACSPPTRSTRPGWPMTRSAPPTPRRRRNWLLRRPGRPTMTARQDRCLHLRHCCASLSTSRATRACTASPGRLR
jgi:hypothetical protein